MIGRKLGPEEWESGRMLKLNNKCVEHHLNYNNNDYNNSLQTVLKMFSFYFFIFLSSFHSFVASKPEFAIGKIKQICSRESKRKNIFETQSERDDGEREERVNEGMIPSTGNELSAREIVTILQFCSAFLSLDSLT